MFTLCAVESNDDAMIIEDITRRIYPNGHFVLIPNRSEMINYIMDHQPGIVWLEALEENFTITSIKRKHTPHINFIFIADTAQMAYDAMRVKASGYILRPLTEDAIEEELKNLRFKCTGSENRMTVQCFDKFEVYLNGKIMQFSRSLSKEALAYLIDNKGAACTIQEICDVLWENRPVSTSLKSQCRVIMSSLKKDLEAYVTVFMGRDDKRQTISNGS